MFPSYILEFATEIGDSLIKKIKKTGEFTLFAYKFLITFINKPLSRKQLIQYMYVVSIQSFGIILLTGAFAGLAVALQAYIGFSRVHAEQFTGLVATLGIVRELGPVLTGIIVSAKTGSSIAAELGTMKITEQIDALKTLGIDPFNFLVVPRILATTIMLPFLTIFAMIFGISSSYILCVVTLSINEQAYISIIQEYLKLNDIVGGLIKALVFGFIISLMGTYMGYKTEGGARGVGIATTAAVVSGSILILIGNYILSSFLYNTGIS
jgi:phospholipid/cholesterol/gamma-HCH transport system permease protein